MNDRLSLHGSMAYWRETLVLVFAFEQLHDANVRDVAILRSLLHSAQERLWRYEAMVEPPTHGEVF